MSEPKPSMATKLYDAVLETDAIIFSDQYGDGCIAFNGDGTNVELVKSQVCKQWLTKLCREQFNALPSPAALNQVVQMLEADATFGKIKHDLDVSIVRHGEEIWYDLGSSAVRLGNKTFSIVKRPPILFRRPTGQLPQVPPERDGDAKQLLNFVNIKNESEQLLFLCYVIAAFVPDIQHPALILHGTQGAGKTTPMQMLKSLIDHTALDSGLTAPDKEETFILNAYHNYFMFYDNLTNVKDNFSDQLCRAVTGSSFLTRKLYTTTDVFLYSFRRTVVINGIDQVAMKSDLLDRSILLQLNRIAPEKRKEHGQLWREFNKAKPQILGGIFDTLIKAEKIRPSIKLPTSLSRMTDFDRLGCAIAEALGYSQAQFIEARTNSTAIQNEHAIEANPVGQAVMKFLEDRTGWTGTAAALYDLLLPIFFSLHLERPKSAPALAKALRTLEPNLLAVGIGVRFTRGDERLITFYQITDDADGTDGK